jgi:hypothetical protein
MRALYRLWPLTFHHWPRTCDNAAQAPLSGGSIPGVIYRKNFFRYGLELAR